MADMPNAEIPVSVSISGLECLQCIGEYNEAKKKGWPEEQWPKVNMATTLAPSWVSQAVGGQLAMACVAVPSCRDHLETREETAQEKAMKGGIILGGG